MARTGLPASAIDAVVVGNALGAGGNPARMVALAAGLDEACAAYSVDSQCCAGLDAVGLAVGLVQSGQAAIVLAGGVEAWSRSPIRAVRPLWEGDPARPYERPPFSPDPLRDPDLLEAAARHAWEQGHFRAQQDHYALQSHGRALAHGSELADEIVPVSGLGHDSYPRVMTPMRSARLPVSMGLPDVDPGGLMALSPLAISAKADGAAFVILGSAAAFQRLCLPPRATLLAQAGTGGDPAMPLLSAELATRKVLARAGLPFGRLQAVELHDAFATQGLAYCRSFGIAPEQINRRGGGLARGHPIGASGAICLVRVLADVQRDGASGALGLAAIAGAGGIGSAALVSRL
jgi:acetyl-CoA C-acetyltransferase